MKNVEKYNNDDVIPFESIGQQIFVIRGQKVMVDRSLAILYGVTTRHLNRQVKRNIQRFPIDFMFQLTREEKSELVPKWYQLQSLKHSKSLPYAFTEHGVAMLASILNSEQAIKMSLIIIKTFIKLRQFVSTHKELAIKIAELDKKIEHHDEDIIAIFNAIRKLMQEEDNPKKKIGFLRN